MQTQMWTVWNETPASVDNVIRILSNEYGMKTEKGKSFVPGHVAIQVPVAHATRATRICERFGRRIYD